MLQPEEARPSAPESWLGESRGVGVPLSAARYGAQCARTPTGETLSKARGATGRRSGGNGGFTLTLPGPHASLAQPARPQLPWLHPHTCPTWSPRVVGCWVVGAQCTGDCKAASGPRGLPRPLYSARPAPRGRRAPPGSIHLLLRTRHRTAQSEPPGRTVRPSVLAGRGRRRGRSGFHLFLNALLKVETASGASVAFFPRGSARTPTPPIPLREGSRNCTRKSLIHILGSRPGR